MPVDVFSSVCWFSVQTWHAILNPTFYSEMIFITMLMFALSFPSMIALANTLVINGLEWRRKIGALRTVGSSRKQV